MSRNWIIAGVAAVCFVTGVALSHVIEPGVRVEKVMLTANTPALRLFPATPGPHPVALLAHGATGSKEMFSLMCTLGISMLLLPSTLVGRIATRGGSRRDGDVAMAIFASYVDRAIYATVLLKSES